MPQASIGTSGAQLFRRSPYRRSFMVHNKSANIIYIETMAPSTISTSNAGVIIPAGATRWFNWWEDGSREITDEWSIIADGASSDVIYKEFSGYIKTEELERAVQEGTVQK